MSGIGAALASRNIATFPPGCPGIPTGPAAGSGVLNMQTLPWIVALAALALILPALTYWVLRPRKTQPKPLPTEWALAARPVFSADERRVYRLLREALPHHIVLSKLPLVRFCQPTDAAEVRYWYDLLGNSHVSFAICSANGRVLAAIDLDTDRGSSRRAMQIKQSVLAACRVRYLRCPVDHLPSVAEVQLLVPQSGTAPRGPQPAPTPAPARNLNTASETLSSTVASRRAERTALWQDSTFFRIPSSHPTAAWTASAEPSSVPSPGAHWPGPMPIASDARHLPTTCTRAAVWWSTKSRATPRPPGTEPAPDRH